MSKNGLLLRGDRLMIPVTLRNRVLKKIAHEAHLGITKTKVWWPGIDRHVEEMINNCDLCQAVGNSILGIMDETTRWPEVAVIRSTTAETIMKCLDSVFSCWGNPKEIILDNGP